MKSLQVKELDTAGIQSVYENHLVFDFPAEEQKPLARILELNREGLYPCFGLFEGKSLRGYACFCVVDGVNVALLDYLSVIRTKRSSGYGGKFLRLLRSAVSAYAGCILEVEDDAFAFDEEDRKMRQRRFAFYFANGVKLTGLRGSVRNVKYRIMFLPFQDMPQDKEILDALNLIYQSLYRGVMLDRTIGYVET